jgi:hypothetical protein
MMYDPRQTRGGPGSGYVPGYNDPLSQPYGPGGMGGPGSFQPGQFLRGGPMPGGSPMMGAGGAPMTSARQNAVRGVGSYIREPLDWLKEGAGKVGDWLGQGDNLATAAQLAGTAAQVYGANQDRKRYDEYVAYEREREEEDRRRGEEYGPLMGAVLQRLTSTQGG